MFTIKENDNYSVISATTENDLFSYNFSYKKRGSVLFDFASQVHKKITVGEAPGQTYVGVVNQSETSLSAQLNVTVCTPAENARIMADIAEIIEQL